MDEYCGKYLCLQPITGEGWVLIIIGGVAVIAIAFTLFRRR